MDDKDKDKDPENITRPDAKPVEDSMFRRFQNIWDEIADRRGRAGTHDTGHDGHRTPV